MGKGDWKKELTNIINDKRFLNVVCILLVLVFVLLAISSLTIGRRKKTTNMKDATQSSASMENEVEDKTEENINNYEAKEKTELKKLLTKMESVGEVEVMIYFKGGEIQVPATEKTAREATTEETDNQGGKRTSFQVDDGSKIVMSGNGSENQPYILQTNKPEISGVMIVAEGANNSKVKYDIQVAVSTLYGISIDKVNVYPMKN